jgi:hypothetical protein
VADGGGYTHIVVRAYFTGAVTSAAGVAIPKKESLVACVIVERKQVLLYFTGYTGYSGYS